MGTAADRRTVGFGAVMKRLHYAWIIVSVTFLILLAVQGCGCRLVRLWSRGNGSFQWIEAPSR